MGQSYLRDSSTHHLPLVVLDEANVCTFVSATVATLGVRKQAVLHVLEPSRHTLEAWRREKVGRHCGEEVGRRAMLADTRSGLHRLSERLEQSYGCMHLCFGLGTPISWFSAATSSILYSDILRQVNQAPVVGAPRK